MNKKQAPIFVLWRTFLLLQFMLLSLWNFAQTDLGMIKDIDPEILNKFILQEVNEYRKKAKVEPLENKIELLPAAQDHADYLRRESKLTHFQKGNKAKKSPKNRVDFYGMQFNRVGENVQLNNLNIGSKVDDKENPPVATYEQLAAKLVLSWRNSPPHYANMIDPDFESTFTAFSISESGEVYACQLFGGSMYEDKYAEFNDTVTYKPENPRRCWECDIRPPIGQITVTADRSIYFEYQAPRLKMHVTQSRMRFFNPWKDGLAADILVKSQYPCDSSSNFNGRRAVRGIPLKPVYKKDFGMIGLMNTRIYLGKVPDYITEEYEVNLTIVRNKRTCSNVMYNFIPSGYYVEIPLSYGFEPKDAIRENSILDTLSNRMYFNKSMIVPNDSVLPDILKMVDDRQAFIQRIELSGYSSIEGSSENNMELYSQRTDYLLKYLISKGIDSSKIKIRSEENFRDFRKDIIGTPFEKLGKLSDAELKEKLNDKQLVSDLEFLLKNHRYVEIKVFTKENNKFKITKEIAQKDLQKYIDQKNIKKSQEMQQIEYGLALDGEIELDDLSVIEIPHEKKFTKLLHDRAVMKFHLDSLNENRLFDLEEALLGILPLDTTNKSINTSLEIIKYYKYEMGLGGFDGKDYFKYLKKKKYVDLTQKARIILNFSTGADWGRFLSTGSRKSKKYYYPKVKSYIRQADLDVDKTFEIASYYSFFWQYKYAYSLVNGLIDETENPEDIIYFLKLIHLTNIKLPRETYLRCFKKIRKYSGKEFCTYFNNPALNFQILDDEEIKEIYCKECAGYVAH